MGLGEMWGWRREGGGGYVAVLVVDRGLRWLGLFGWGIGEGVGARDW